MYQHYSLTFISRFPFASRMLNTQKTSPPEHAEYTNKTSPPENAKSSRITDEIGLPVAPQVEHPWLRLEAVLGQGVPDKLHQSKVVHEMLGIFQLLSNVDPRLSRAYSSEALMFACWSDAGELQTKCVFTSAGVAQEPVAIKSLHMPLTSSSVHEAGACSVNSSISLSVHKVSSFRVRTSTRFFPAFRVRSSNCKIATT